MNTYTMSNQTYWMTLEHLHKTVSSQTSWTTLEHLNKAISISNGLNDPDLQHHSSVIRLLLSSMKIANKLL